MFKGFLQTLILLTFLINTDSAIGSAPGPDAWKDDAGRLAPATVRQAADNLWAAVAAEGEAAWNAGVGMLKKPECGCTRILMNILFCGIPECSAARNPNFGKVTFIGAGAGNYGLNKALYDQSKQEVAGSLQKFKEIVNASVSRPEQYSGDANMCQVGPWVEDGRRTVGDCTGIASSVSHDLSAVPQSVRAFVNAHGGWASLQVEG